MKISYDWLKEYVDLKLPPEKLAETLTMAGLSVESVSKAGEDSILEVEITANRPDWLSVIGVAREVAALTGGKLRVPSIVYRPSFIVKGKKRKKSGVAEEGDDKRITVHVDCRELCPRYTARVIRGVGVAQSPEWLRKRIEAMGLRSVNNVVDITNFCLFETGEPMHAFDLDRLSGARVEVRGARKGEKITLIDGSEKALDETMLVIADAGRPVAVAGVMGGIGTEVTYSTKNILLEAAYFDPVSVRRTSRKLGVSTDSSYRFERRVDIGGVGRASDRAAALILEAAGGTPGEFIDVKAPAGKAAAITLGLGRLNSVLGAAIPSAKVKKIVTALGMKVKSSSKGALRLEAPGFRNDLKGDIDVIEEVARVYGYGKIPSTIPPLVEQPVRVEPAAAAGLRAHELLAGLGYNEIMTYSLMGRAQAAAAGASGDDIIVIKNPLTSEQEAMRPSLIPGMLGAMAWNMNRKSRDLRLFEIGNVYTHGAGGACVERKSVCAGIAGQAFESWSGRSRQADFFELKGAAEALLAGLGAGGAAFSRARRAAFSGACCAEISVAGRPVGVIGEVAGRALREFDIRERVYMFEMDAETVFAAAPTARRFEELPRFPSVFRDISIVVAGSTANADIVSVVRASSGPLLRDARLIDMYTGKQVPEGKVSLTYRLEYRDPTKTLEEKDVAKVHAGILRALDEKLGAKLR